MARGKNQWVVTVKEGGWGVHGEGNGKRTKITETKREAKNLTRDISRNQNSEVIIQKGNGEIQERNSHGNDPFPPKG